MNASKKLLCTSILMASVSQFSMAGQDGVEKEVSDAWLDGKAETTLLLNTNLNSFDIDTDVEKGVVTLSGNVENEIDKRLAEELIENLDGVKDVDNKLTVMSDEPLTDKLVSDFTDAKVSSVVKSKLLMESEVSGTDIDVDVNNGIVTLKGEVDSSAEKDLAEAIASNSSDVKKVINKLSVQS